MPLKPTPANLNARYWFIREMSVKGERVDGNYDDLSASHLFSISAREGRTANRRRVDQGGFMDERREDKTQAELRKNTLSP